MARKRRRHREGMIEDVLDPGRFIEWRGSWDFIERLEEAKAEVDTLLKQGEAAEAVDLYETFIAGCYEKADEIDDSSGSFGQFVEDLYCGWIRARRAAGTDPKETAETLVTWMEDLPGSRYP